MPSDARAFCRQTIQHDATPFLHHETMEEHPTAILAPHSTRTRNVGACHRLKLPASSAASSHRSDGTRRLRIRETPRAPRELMSHPHAMLSARHTPPSDP